MQSKRVPLQIGIIFIAIMSMIAGLQWIYPVAADSSDSVGEPPPVQTGNPVYEEAKEFPPGSGKIWEPVDFGPIVQNVCLPDRDNCGTCHFFGGGGNGVKHGDLDSSMFHPDKSLDG